MGMLLAYDTEMRLQEEWMVEAGPAYYDETVAGVKRATAEAKAAAAGREPKPYSNKRK